MRAGCTLRPHQATGGRTAPVRFTVLLALAVLPAPKSALRHPQAAAWRPAPAGYVMRDAWRGQRLRDSHPLLRLNAAPCALGDARVVGAALVLWRRTARCRGRTTLQQKQGHGDEGVPEPRLGSSRAPGRRRLNRSAPATVAFTPPGEASGVDRELTLLRKIVHGCVAAMTVLAGFVLGASQLAFNVMNYFIQRKRRPMAAYIASWIVHRVLVSVCEEVRGLQVRVDAESSLKLLGGEVTGITIMASRVRLLDVSVGDVGIYTDDVRFVQAATNGSLSEQFMAMGSASSRSDGVMELIAPQHAFLLPSPSGVGASRPMDGGRLGGDWEERQAGVTGEAEAELERVEAGAEEEEKERGRGEEIGGLTVAEPFAASLVASLTEKDVNESPPIMYILKELLTFLVRFGLSIGARKTLGGDQWREESFNSTSVELSYVKLCKDNTLRVDAALAFDRKQGTRANGPAKLPLTIRLGLDLEDDGRCIIVRQPELVTKGIFQREIFVPFMPLARSGADLGPDFHLSKLQVKEGLLEAEGIVVVRPPTSLTAEQEIAELEGGGAALESEIDELRRIEMARRERDSMAKGSHVDKQRMQVEGEIRMSRWRAAERRRRRNQRLVTVTEATRKALSPLDSIRAQVNVSAMGSYVNTSAYAAYLRGMNMSAFVNASAAAQRLENLRGVNRTMLGEYAMPSSEALRRVLNSTLQSTYLSVGPLAAALTGSLKSTQFLGSLKGQYSLEEALMLQQEMEEVQRLAGGANASQPGVASVGWLGGQWATRGELFRPSSLRRGNSTTSLLRAMSPFALSPATRAVSSRSDAGFRSVVAAAAKGLDIDSKSAVGGAFARGSDTDAALRLQIDARMALDEEALRGFLWPTSSATPQKGTWNGGGAATRRGEDAGEKIDISAQLNARTALDDAALRGLLWPVASVETREGKGDGAALDDAALRRVLWPTPSVRKARRVGWMRRAQNASGDSGRNPSRRQGAGAWWKHLGVWPPGQPGSRPAAAAACREDISERKQERPDTLESAIPEDPAPRARRRLQPECGADGEKPAGQHATPGLRAVAVRGNDVAAGDKDREKRREGEECSTQGKADAILRSTGGAAEAEHPGSECQLGASTHRRVTDGNDGAP